MARPIEFLVNGNRKDVNSGGFSDGKTIECQGAWLDFLLLVMDIVWHLSGANVPCHLSAQNMKPNIK